MSTSRRRGTPTPLENVRRRFERWRRTRTARTRIPESLWTATVKMAGKYGVHQTAKTLRIDYYELKKRAQAEGFTSTSVPTGGEETAFVKLVRFRFLLASASWNWKMSAGRRCGCTSGELRPRIWSG